MADDFEIEEFDLDVTDVVTGLIKEHRQCAADINRIRGFRTAKETAALSLHERTAAFLEILVTPEVTV